MPSASAEGGGWGAAPCIRATSTRTPTDPGPPNPLTTCGSGVAGAADDELDFGSRVLDIALQYMAACPRCATNHLPYMCAARRVRRFMARAPFVLTWPTVSGLLSPSYGTAAIFYPTAAVVPPPWHILDGLVQSGAFGLLSPHAPILGLAFLCC